MNKVFVEPPSPEPKVRPLILMHQLTKETKFTQCEYLLGKPEEIFQIINKTDAIRYRIKNADAKTIKEFY